MLPYNRRRIWLDDLPPDVCERIAAWVGRTYLQSYAVEYSTSLLQLAETSHSQRDAVIAVFLNKFELTNRTALHAERWSWIFWSRMRCLQVEVDHNVKDQFKVGNLVHTLMHSPSLSRVIIRDDWSVMWATRYATASLRSLQISLYRSLNVRPVVLALSCLNLCELQMQCHSSPECYFIKLQQEGSESLSFPQLVSADLCCNLHESHEGKLKWPIFGSVPVLRELKLSCPNTEVHGDALCQLAALDSLELAQGLGGLQLAAQMGHSITKVSSQTDAVDAVDISKLSACPRLSSLVVRLNPGAELALPAVASSLHTLSATFSRQRNALFDEWEPLGEWEPGLMLGIVLNAKKLRYFDVRGVRVSEQELVAVLKHMGPRLEGFSTSVIGQGEPPWKRLLKLMTTMSEYNGSLKIFHGDFQSLDVEEVSDTDAKELVDALSHLRKRAPGLVTGKYSVANLVSFIVNHQSEDRRCQALEDLKGSFELEKRRMGMGQRTVISFEAHLESA